MPLVNPPNGVIGCQLTAYGFPLNLTHKIYHKVQREKMHGEQEGIRSSTSLKFRDYGLSDKFFSLIPVFLRRFTTNPLSVLDFRLFY